MPLRWPQEIQNNEHSQIYTYQRARPKALNVAQVCSFCFTFLLQAKFSFFAKQSHLTPPSRVAVDAHKGLRRRGRLRSRPIAKCRRKGAAERGPQLAL